MFNKNLKRIRLQNSYTQKDVADFLHLSPQSISKWENGEATPSIDFLPKLAQMFECSIDDFFKAEECNVSAVDDVKKFLCFLNFFEKKEWLEACDDPVEFMSQNDGWQHNCKRVYESLSKEKFISLQMLQSIFGCDSNEVKHIAEILEKNDVIFKVPDSKFYAVNAETVDCSFPLIKVSRVFAEMAKEKNIDKILSSMD